MSASGRRGPNTRLHIVGSVAEVFRAVSPAATVNRSYFEAPASQRVELHQLITGTQDWVMGVDGGDSNKWKLSSADDALLRQGSQ